MAKHKATTKVTVKSWCRVHYYGRSLCSFQNGGCGKPDVILKIILLTFSVALLPVRQIDKYTTRNEIAVISKASASGREKYAS